MNIKKAIPLKQYILHLIYTYSFFAISLIVIALLAGLLEIAVEYKITEIIDTIAAKKTTAIHYLLILFVLYKLMHHLVFFVARILNIRYKPSIIEHIVVDMYHKTIQHSLQWFDSHLSGEISNKISDFQNSIDTLITQLFRIFNTLTALVISFIFVTRIHLLPATVLLLFTIIYATTLYYLLKKQMVIQELYVRTRQSAIGMMNDAIANIFSIKVIGNSSADFKTNIQPAVLLWKSYNIKTRKFNTYYVDNADTILKTIMSAIQIYLLAYLYQSGYITAGQFTFIAITTLKIQYQLDHLIESIIYTVNPCIAQLKSSYIFIAQPIEINDPKNPEIVTDITGSIKYKNVTFTYQEDDKPVLRNFNLSIAPGEHIGIVGKSGAGKTTMTKCLIRYFDVQSGAIYIDGHDIRAITQEALRDAISIIPQDITLLHRSIKDNLRLAKYTASDEEIISACKQAKIDLDITAMPNGYDTIVGERGVKLSGGQRQRIAIARAILKNAPILILDEATSSLDTPTEKQIQQSIDTLLKKSNATVIAIAHRLSTLKNMNRIIVLDKGKIIESGTHKELINKTDGAYRNLWDTQAI